MLVRCLSSARYETNNATKMDLQRLITVVHWMYWEIWKFSCYVFLHVFYCFHLPAARLANTTCFLAIWFILNYSNKSDTFLSIVIAHVILYISVYQQPWFNAVVTNISVRVPRLSGLDFCTHAHLLLHKIDICHLLNWLWRYQIWSCKIDTTFFLHTFR